MRKRTFVLCSLLLAMVFTWWPGTARACACGALITESGASIDGETALIVHDGGTETIDMVMSLDGEASSAAWIMPVPSGTQVSLGNREVFDRLHTITAPKPRYVYDWSPGFGGTAKDRGPIAGAAGVTVLRTQVVGPFEVTTLDGTSASSVNSWLVDHGYPSREALEPTFQDYLDDGWNIIAVKLVPGADATLLAAEGLDALRMTFATDRPIYPIKLSRHAQVDQRLRLYVAARHRMDASGPTSRPGELLLRFAGTVPGSEIGLGDGQWFLTSYQATLFPADINTDIAFARSATDEAYQATYTVVVPIGSYALLALLGTGALAAIAVPLLLLARRQARRQPRT